MGETVLTVLLAIISTVLILVGLAGVILPIIPGVLIAWIGLFIFAIGTGFERIFIPTVLVFFVVMLLTFALDYIMPIVGAKKYKASKWGIVGSVLGSLAGIIILSVLGIFGIWGIIVAPFLGALAGELIATRKHRQAFKAAFGTFLGIITGTLIKIVVILIMLGFLIASWF